MLEVKKLLAGYGNVIVLRDISFAMKLGETVAIIGANGAGKTTLLWALSGLIHPISGRIMFNNQDVTGWSCRRIIEAGITHVPQGMQVFSELTVDDNLMLAAYGRGIDFKTLGKESVANVHKYFPVLEKKRKQSAGSLSGGEKQMLAIARGLICKPKLLMLDEPSTGLAPLLVRQVFGILNDLHKTLYINILLVEQNAEAALRFAERALVLAQGQIILDDSGRALLESEQVKNVYLGAEVLK